MAIQLPNYGHDYAVAPAPAAYGYIVTETATFSDMSGTFQVDVWQDVDSYNAGKLRIDTVGLRLGTIVREAAGETPAVRLATLAELLAEAEFGAAFGVIRARLYQEAKKHPKLANGTDVP